MPPDDSERLADSIETASADLIGELKGVRDSVEELYILLDHIWRNREELRDIVAGLLEDKLEQSDANESVACCQCNAFWPSLAAGKMPMPSTAWLIFLGSALLEVGGDAVVRRGLRGANVLIIVAGVSCWRPMAFWSTW